MKTRRLFLSVGVACLLCGCAQKFTHERFAMIQPGADDRTDVREILGKPRLDNGDLWVYEDPDNHQAAIIHFDSGGRVNGKEWMDAMTGSWEGQNPHAESAPAGEVRETRTKTRTIDKP